MLLHTSEVISFLDPFLFYLCVSRKISSLLSLVPVAKLKQSSRCPELSSLCRAPVHLVWVASSPCLLSVNNSLKTQTLNQMSVIQLLGSGGSCTSESAVGGLRRSALTLHPGFLGWTGRRPGICFCFCFCCCPLFLRVPRFEAQPRALNTIGPTSRSFQYQLSSLDLLGVSSAHFIFA